MSTSAYRVLTPADGLPYLKALVEQNEEVATGTFHHDAVVEAMRAVIECAHQAPFDLCGDQRAFFLPRLRKAAVMLGQAFPGAFLTAMEGAKDAWGDPVADPPTPKPRRK